MYTKKIVIDDEVMECLKELSAIKGRSLDELTCNYGVIYEMGQKAKMGLYKPDKSQMSPSLATLCGFMGEIADDYDWKKDLEDELYIKLGQ